MNQSNHISLSIFSQRHLWDETDERNNRRRFRDIHAQLPLLLPGQHWMYLAICIIDERRKFRHSLRRFRYAVWTRLLDSGKRNRFDYQQCSPTVLGCHPFSRCCCHWGAGDMVLVSIWYHRVIYWISSSYRESSWHGWVFNVLIDQPKFNTRKTKKEEKKHTQKYHTQKNRQNNQKKSNNNHNPQKQDEMGRDETRWKKANPKPIKKVFTSIEYMKLIWIVMK